VGTGSSTVKHGLPHIGACIVWGAGRLAKDIETR